MRFKLAFLALFGSALFALAQCPGGRCEVRQIAPAGDANKNAKIEWLRASDDSQALYVDGIHRGSLNRDGLWLPVVGNAWGERRQLFPTSKVSRSKPCPGGVCIGSCECKKCECQAVAQAKADEPQNFGMEWEPRAKKERWTASGEEVTPATADRVLNRRKIGDGQLTDDSGLLDVTVIGTTEDRKRVLKDLDDVLELATYKGKVSLHAFAPDHWIVKESGFRAGTSPTIYVQKSNGEVLHRQEGYEGADAPHNLAVALRRSDPSYDPAKDPDLAKPKPPEPKPEPLPPLPPTPKIDPAPVPTPKPEQVAIPDWVKSNLGLLTIAGLVGILVITKGRT